MKLLLALLPLFGALFQAAPQPAPLRTDWIEKDLRQIERFRSAMQAESLDVEMLVEKLGAIESGDDRDGGFGARRVRMHLYGGYTTIWIDALAVVPGKGQRSRVAILRARQLGPRDQWGALEPRLAAAWNREVRAIGNGLEYERRDAELERELRARTTQALGAPTPVEVPDTLRAAYDVLTDPLEEVVLGSSYGDDGGPPPGRAQIEALVKAGRFDLVRAILRGLNVEGRLYAAWALRTRAGSVLDAADQRAIEAVLALPHAVHTTHGCEQTWIAPKEALRFLETER